MEKITITRGLRELKLLDERITKTINNLEFVDVFQSRNPGIVLMLGKQKAEFESQVKEKIQSLSDLIERRAKIKSAIMKSNSETKVKIAGLEYFVIDAIEKKSSLKYDRVLLLKMKTNLTNIKQNIDKNKADIDYKVENMVTQALGADKKNDKDIYEQISKPFIEANELKMVDPIGVEKRIEKLDKEISEFEAEVDFVLSESNSKTEIEI